jgi:hypothetical protein
VRTTLVNVAAVIVAVCFLGLATLMALSSLANLASPSHTERTTNPVAVAVTLLCIVVAVAARRSARLPATAS